MSIQHTNRTGKTYYLREGKTKTGKPRYFFSTKPEGKGKPVDRIPEGYEIYEHPQNAQAFLRKARPRLITEAEEQLVQKYLNELNRPRRYRSDCKDELITIWESDVNFEGTKSIFDEFMTPGGLFPGQEADDKKSRFLNVIDRSYTPVMRFQLDNREKRTFIAERYCFRGSIDDWIFLDGPGDLESLLEKNIKLLGTDDLFEAPFFWL